MTIRFLTLATLAILAACGQDQPPQQQQQKSIGGQIGDSYKDMLDTSKQSVEQLNEQMLRTEQAVHERTR